MTSEIKLNISTKKSTRRKINKEQIETINIMKFAENESYKHKFAKELLISWIESEPLTVSYHFKINDINDSIYFNQNNSLY